MSTPVLRATVALHAASLALTVARPRRARLAFGLCLANHLALTAAALRPRGRLLGPHLERLPPSCANAVALTFDDGPDPEVTPRVLDLLDRAGAQATFFCIGARARRHPDLVRSIVARGHAVGNHTDRHLARFALLGPVGLAVEIDRAAATLADLTGSRPKLFRAPMGIRSPLLAPLLAARGLTLVSWTRRALDGARIERTRALARLLPNGRPIGRDILLLHDGGFATRRAGGPLVLAVLPDLLASIASCGLRSVSLDAAMRHRGSRAR